MNETMEESIGTVIKYLRETKELKQSDLAKHIGKTSNYLSMIETGKRKPSLDLLFKLSRYFNVDLGTMFTWAEIFYKAERNEDTD